MRSGTDTKTGTDRASDGPKLTTQFTRFILVGGLNTAVDLAVLNALIFGFDAGREGFLFTVFKTVAFTVAVVNSYIMNKLWTFEAHDKKISSTVTPFIVVSLIGLIFNVGTASIFASYVHPPADFLTGLWPSIASLAGTGAGLVWNFIGYRTVVFNGSDAPDVESPKVEAPAAAAEPTS